MRPPADPAIRYGQGAITLTSGTSARFSRPGRGYERQHGRRRAADSCRRGLGPGPAGTAGAGQAALLVLAPLVLAFFGIRGLPASTWRVPADLALLAVSAALSLGLGVWRGQTIRVWRDADGTWWRQGSVLTLALWGVLIVARGLLYGVGVAVGHRDASGLGAVLVTLALSFAAQNTVTALRMNAAQPLPGGQPAEAAAGRGMAIPPQLAAHWRWR